MAALECNNGQDGFSPTENGDALAEEKSLSIDYSEDLWLANSEDSSGPYAQHPNKVIAHEQPTAHPVQVETRDTYSNVSSTGGQIESHSIANEYTETHPVAAQGHTWNDAMAEEEAEETALQPATTYINGTSEHNGMDFSSGGEEKDFAQLVPAGSYVESGSVVGVENQDKTFTSLMPAAAIGVNGEMQQGFTTMLNTNQEGIVYYESSEHLPSDSSPVTNQENSSVTYEQNTQMAAIKEGDEGGTEGAGTMYVAMDNLSAETQSAAGNFAVLSPAMINMTNVNTDGASYPGCVSGGTYHTISTLPFVQNGAYSSQSSFAYQTTAAIVSGDETSQQQQQHSLQQAEYSSDQTNYGSEANTMSASLQDGDVEYVDDGPDDDDDPDQDMEENSIEYSEFSCPICSEGFADQATLDDHVNNHPPLKSFVCETCGKGFATRRYLKYHRKNHCKRAGSYEGRNELDENDPNGEVKRFACNVCSRPFRVLKCMKVHKKKKHGIMKEYTCQNCAVTFETSPELIEHACEPKSASSTPQIIQYTPPPLALPAQKKKRKLKQAKPACDICGKTFSDRISVDIHRVKHIEEELYPCDMCREDETVDPNHLAVHFRIRFFTDDNQHILEDQKAAAANQDTTRSDDGSSVSATPVHNPDTPIPGSSTPQSAPATPIYIPATPIHAPGTPVSASSQDGQMLDATGQIVDQQGYVHKYIEYTTTSADGRQTVHVGNYIVNQNDAILVSDQGMLSNQHRVEQVDAANQHLYSSQFEGEIIHDASGSVMAVTPKKKKWKRSKIHMCDICNKSFGDTAKLELHYKSNHLHDRPYQCDVCEKSFFTKWKLQRHMLSHLEQKPHSCPMCSKSFVERGKLEAHYRTHLGTKPYKCDQCPKAFTVKSQLSIHQRRIHSTDQPFGCLVCGKAFLWKSGLDKHMRKHTREKPFICETCGMKYSNKANLIVHMSKAHNQTYVDKPGQ
uniref:C2H2-type domain-containing protein n=1 Tax=Biomphalaria glabrata TaxID=6526 RepID=A0A2C9JEI8_BIOGL